MIGQGLYAGVLFLNMLPAMTRWMESISRIRSTFEGKFFGNPRPEKISYIVSHPRVLGQILCRIIWWLLVRFFSLWIGGLRDHYDLTFVYLAIEVWETLLLLDLKLSNHHLLDGSESSWGFGQVLPIFMLAMIGLSVLDIKDQPEPVETMRSAELALRGGRGTMN
jgi:hypothetical protein